jgi:hypothetical protein
MLSAARRLIVQWEWVMRQIFDFIISMLNQLLTPGSSYISQPFQTLLSLVVFLPHSYSSNTLHVEQLLGAARFGRSIYSCPRLIEACSLSVPQGRMMLGEASTARRWRALVSAAAAGPQLSGEASTARGEVSPFDRATG